MKNRYTYNKHGQQRRFTKRYAVLSSAIILIALVLSGLEFTNTTYFFHEKPQPPTASAETKGEPASQIQDKGTGAAQNNTSNNQSISPPSEAADKGTGTATLTLLAPTGEFVSNHHPNLSGSPAPNEMSSVCTSTPGASCRITFTKGSVTKSLESQATDRGGSAYWGWKLQDIGLTAGSWQIKAIASLNGQTKTASDAMNLEVAE